MIAINVLLVGGLSRRSAVLSSFKVEPAVLAAINAVAGGTGTSTGATPLVAVEASDADAAKSVDLAVKLPGLFVFLYSSRY